VATRSVFSYYRLRMKISATSSGGAVNIQAVGGIIDLLCSDP
jgi:hypothetical protein